MLTSEALITCLPPQAYDRTAPGVLAEVATAAKVLDGAINLADVILSEHQPGKTALALQDWERNYGLPDDCAGGLSATEAARRASLLERISARGDLSRAYFIAQAERLGYPGCTITEYGPMSCADPCDSYLNSPEFIGLWKLNVPMSTAVLVMTCEATCDSPLASWGNEQMECVINRRKPATTHVIFGYAP